MLAAARLTASRLLTSASSALAFGNQQAMGSAVLLRRPTICMGPLLLHGQQQQKVHASSCSNASIFGLSKKPQLGLASTISRQYSSICCSPIQPRPNRLLLEAAAAITQPARTIIWPRGHLDIVNRRRRMKRHQLKKFRKRCAAMLRDKRLLREKKKEAEFQEQLHHMKLRTFGSDPFQKIEQQLKLARRSGYHADLLAKIDVKSGGNIKPKF
ncbi:hypothetical protein BOX15_Mlig020914g2 [Macrostomum lignano]|uniref:Mitochondrial mRNA-processing protein COX24 C-terminal domain-containing protein n=1 Tax=Macrostomum lignano TaxID=282301 RepID=A0A267GI69_9PLAT|nr:hypothetical protein BOX15_Mlig020914g2 [Macrostomum lignano]